MHHSFHHSNADCQEAAMCSTRGRSQGTCNMLGVINAGLTLALKPTGDVIRNPKQGPKIGRLHVSAKNILKIKTL